MQNWAEVLCHFYYQNDRIPVAFIKGFEQWSFLVTASARLLGPQLSGLLSPIPVLAWPLCIFVHVQQGSDGALAVLRGNLQGAYGVCVFYTVFGMLVRSWDPDTS